MWVHVAVWQPCELLYTCYLPYLLTYLLKGQYAWLCQISSKSVKRLPRYGDLTDFAKWRPSAILDLFGGYWDIPRLPLGGLYRCAKFGWNRCSSLDNIKFSLFCQLGLKKPINAPRIGGLGKFHPLIWGAISTKPPPKGTPLRVVWAIKREHPPTGLTCWWVHEKKVYI